MTQTASKKKPVVVGIDLGTTHSAIAYLDDRGEPQTIVNSEGDRTTPSVALIEQEEVTVGKQAVKAQVTLPDHVAVFAKRDIGKATLSHPVDGRNLSPELVESFILRRLRDDAETRLGRPIEDAVITVPAYFNEPKRRSTIKAAELAGINCIGMVNEPTAAAIAYGLETHSQILGPQTVIVYDLGGGTFDVSMVRVDQKDIKVLATDGNAMLGGMDWDRCLVKWIDDQFHDQCRFRPSEADTGPAWLMQEAMELKHALTARTEVKVRLTFLGQSIHSVITRDAFEEMTAHLLDRTRFTLKKLLRDSNTQWDAIDQVILVGGSTRLPQVSDMLLALTGMEPNLSISADEAIAHGAAIYAATLHDRQARLARQRAGDTSGSESNTDSQADGEDPEPHSSEQTESNPADLSDTSIDLMAEIPDESGEPSKLGLVISDVNAHNLCVLGIDLETRLRCNHVMIGRNTSLPAKKITRFQTVRENQHSVAVDIVEGGDSRGRYGTHIGRCVLGNLPHDLPEGTPVDVTFRYDRDGLMWVQAKLPQTGQKASIEIQRNLPSEVPESIQDDDPEWSIHS